MKVPAWFTEALVTIAKYTIPFALLAAICGVLSAGCTAQASTGESSSTFVFERATSEGASIVEIMTDVQTGTEYIVLHSGDGVAVTPRLGRSLNGDLRLFQEE